MTEPVFTVANQLTMLRMALVPAFVLLTLGREFTWALVVFVVAGLTDALDGYVARHANQSTRLGAMLDPVADKIMVSTALVLLVQRQETNQVVFAIAAAIIIGREIAISALREWMSELGERALVSVSWVGKTKTVFQMTAIGFLLYREDIGWIPVPLIGELLLYTAAALTLWSMWTYLSAAWPVMSRSHLGSDDDGRAGR